MKFKTFEHTADIGVEVFGKDIEELYKNSVYALMYHIVDIEDIKDEEKYVVFIEGYDKEEILINLLNEVLFLFDARDFITKELIIKELGDTYLKGLLKGELKSSQHHIKTEIKLVTYHMLKIEEENNGMKATLVFDV